MSVVCFYGRFIRLYLHKLDVANNSAMLCVVWQSARLVLSSTCAECMQHVTYIDVNNAGILTACSGNVHRMTDTEDTKRFFMAYNTQDTQKPRLVLLLAYRLLATKTEIVYFLSCYSCANPISSVQIGGITIEPSLQIHNLGAIYNTFICRCLCMSTRSVSRSGHPCINIS